MIIIFRRLVEDYLLIKKGEEKKVIFFLIFFAALMMGQEIGTGVSASLFLTNAGIDKLPLMLLIAALVNTAAILSYMLLTSSKGNKAIFYIVIFFGVALIAGAKMFFPLYPALMSYFLFAAAEFLTGAIGLHFGVYIADYFNTRQSKRLFPLIFSGSKIGGIIGGLILSITAQNIGTENVIYIWLGSVASGFIFLLFIDRLFQPEVYDYEKQQKESVQFFRYIKSAVDFLKTSRLLKAIAAGGFLLGFLSLIMRFLYSDVFVRSFPDTDKLTAFFGIYIILSNVLGLLIQLLIANRLIDSLGLGVANIVYAALFSSGFAGLAFSYSLTPAVWARFTDEQLESAIQDPVESLLYNAVPDNERARVRALSSGLIKPVSEITGSIMLSLVKAAASFSVVSFFAFFVSLIYIWVVTQQNKGYVDGLIQMVKDKTISLEDLESLRWEKTSKKELESLYAKATGYDEAARNTAVTILLHLDEDIDFELLRKQFFGWPEDIQESYLKKYFKRSKVIDENFLLRALQFCKPQVQVLLIEYFIESAGTAAAPLILRLLRETEDISIKNSAIRFFYLIDVEGTREAMHILEERLNSSEHDIIHANLSMFRDLYDEKYLEYVKKMIYHPNKSVSIDAVNTLAVIYQPRGREEPEIINLVDELLRRGGYHDLKSAVMILGKRPGKRERDILLSLLDINSNPLKNVITETLLRNYRGDAEIFMKFLESSDVPLNARENIISVIKELKDDIAQERLRNILKSLIFDYFEVISEQDCLRRYNLETSLKADMCERKKTQIRLMILELLELLLHQRVVLSIEKALITNNPRLISNAMELFENLWDKKQAKHLITLLYPESFEEELKISREFTGGIELDIADLIKKYLRPDLPRWEICTALLLLKEQKGDGCEFNLDEFKKHPDSLVKEIADFITSPGAAEGSTKNMLSTIEKVIYLKNAPIFKSLKMDELKMVSDIVSERFYAPGEIIIEKGEVGNSMFIIASGQVDIYLPLKDKKTLVVLGEAEFFGEMALFGEELRSASAVALKPTRLLCIEREHFFNLIYEKPDISVEIIKVLSDRIRRMDGTALKLAEVTQTEKEKADKAGADNGYQPQAAHKN